jgi:hypothetical protein
MFAKQAAIAAIALTAISGAFAQSPERNVFDSEAILQLPASASAQGLTREAVQAQYIAQRDAKGISSFNPEAYRQEQIAGAGTGLVALFKRDQAPTTAVAKADGKTRAEVRAEFLAARANGELNQFDTETYVRVTPSVRQPAPTALAQR